jgi:L-lysine exporter family protein LysE/ArgO
LGLMTGLGLIVAIGAQNVFVLRQGIARRHVALVALTAALTDAALIAIGVAGVGAAIASNLYLARIAGAGGALFLVTYGGLALRSAFRAEGPDWGTAVSTAVSSRAAVATTLAISLLNPHVYLDTVVLLGGIGGRLPVDARLNFALGAMTGSVVWFFALAFGAKWLSPLFRRASVRRGLDLFVAAVMFAVALYLVRDLLHA